MTNQSLMLISIVLCSLGGWYVVLTKYLELKAMNRSKPDNHDLDKVQLEPVSADYHKLPQDLNLTGSHLPGMGPPPHPSVPFSIPEDLLAAVNKLRPTSKSQPEKTIPASKAASESKSQSATTNVAKREICNWAAILHLSGLAIITGIPFLNIVIPSILWLLKKEQHPFLAKQGKDVINFQITFTIIQFLCLFAGTIFIWLAPLSAQILFTWTKTLRVVFGTSLHLPYNIFTVLPFFWGCVLMVRGAIAAYHGVSYKYPYSQPFVFTQVAPQASSEPRSNETPGKSTSSIPTNPAGATVFNNINFS